MSLNSWEKSVFYALVQSCMWIGLVAGLTTPAWAGVKSVAYKRTPEESKACEKSLKSYPKRQKIKRSDVYKGAVFDSGEVAEYEVRYYGVLVGYGSLRVKPARRHNKQWVRVFSAEANTGDWYDNIFKARDRIEALSSPDDFSVLKFYIRQDEGKLFGKRLQREKWLDFEHSNCLVNEKIKEVGKAEKLRSHFLEPGTIDTLAIIYNLRQREFKLGKVEKAPIYSSEKNWQLTAKPVAIEMVKVPAGDFKSVKLELQTFIGDELQQKGKVFVWFATDHPARPLVKVEGEIKIGSVLMTLKSFKGTVP